VLFGVSPLDVEDARNDLWMRRNDVHDLPDPRSKGRRVGIELLIEGDNNLNRSPRSAYEG
jgi:hypothetical protein